MKELEYKGPRCDQSVDIAIFDANCENILLGRKKNQTEFRFIGGFSDVNSDSLEEDAVRETFEETHLIVSNPIYILSTKVDDDRYKDTIHEVKTCLFMTVGYEGEPQADDDIEEVKWFPVDEFKTMVLRPEHMRIRDMFFLKTTR